MTVKVVEVELDQPLPDLQDLNIKHYTYLQLLVRKQQRPVGYAWIHIRSPRFLQGDYIRFEIERQLFEELKRAELERRLDQSQQLAPDYNYPNLTIAICTRNRSESLHRALQSLARLDYPAEKLDLLVVDNAPSDDTTRQVVASFALVRYVVEPRPGLDWARNRAIQSTANEIIAYTDDDVEVDSLWAKTLVRHFANPSVMCVTGLVAPAERETGSQNLFEEYNNGFGKGFELRYYTMGVKEHWPYFPLGAGNFGTGCNMAYRKTLFDKIGGFDEALDVGTPTHGAGDLDMFYRTLRAGYILVYEPQALIWHYHRAEMAQLRQQIHDFGRGVYAFWTKTLLCDPPMRRWTLQLALLWFGQGYLRRMLRRRGDQRRLAMIEALGALQGPYAYFQSRKLARKLATQTGLAIGLSKPKPVAQANDAASAEQKSDEEAITPFVELRPHGD